MRIAGRLMLIKIGDGLIPESFTTVACQRGTNKSHSGDMVDVSDKDSRWRQLLGGNMHGIELTASGLIANAVSHRLLTNLALQDSFHRFQIVFADSQTITGSFQVVTWGLSGEYSDAQQYELTLMGADDLVYAESALVLTLIDTVYVNLDAKTDFGISNSDPNQAPVGTLITLSAQPADVIVISKPSVASDANLAWDAWSNKSNSWLNTLRVSDQDDVPLLTYNSGTFAIAASALASTQAEFPKQLSGGTQYVFWGRDVLVTDNSGGLSFKVEQYRYL